MIGLVFYKTTHNEKLWPLAMLCAGSLIATVVMYLVYFAGAAGGVD